MKITQTETSILIDVIKQALGGKRTLKLVSEGPSSTDVVFNSKYSMTLPNSVSFTASTYGGGFRLETSSTQVLVHKKLFLGRGTKSLESITVLMPSRIELGIRGWGDATIEVPE